MWVQVARTLGKSLRSFQPAIRELQVTERWGKSLNYDAWAPQLCCWDFPSSTMHWETKIFRPSFVDMKPKHQKLNCKATGKWFHECYSLIHKSMVGIELLAAWLVLICEDNRSLQQVSKEFKSTLEQEIGLDELRNPSQPPTTSTPPAPPPFPQSSAPLKQGT